ncbi:MAG: hypothetical protein R3C14_44885 [Caldilineaceae bacterium]
MTWAPLLLTDPSPALRWLVLRELLARPADDPEVVELTALRANDPLVTTLQQQQAADGSWPSPGGDPMRTTLQALLRLAYLGFDAEEPMVQRGAAYLFAQQQPDGSWPLARMRAAGKGTTSQDAENEEHEGYAMIPLQTALPLRALAACGLATDPRAEQAYTWLLAQRLEDGAWPTGLAAGNYGYVAGYRRLAHSRWGCRSNTTGALLALAQHPTYCTGPEARRAFDLLLGRETQEAHAMGFEVARLIGAEPIRGFITYYARFDVAMILDLGWRVGVTLEDERMRALVDFVRRAQGDYGLWRYAARPQASRWVTFDLLRSLTRLDQSAGSDWISLEPRTPFRTYARTKRRY